MDAIDPNPPDPHRHTSPALDISEGWIGGRWGYVITMPDGAPIDITIRTPGVSGEIRTGVRADRCTGYHACDSDALDTVPERADGRPRSIQDLGVSIGGLWGTVVSIVAPSDPPPR